MLNGGSGKPQVSQRQFFFDAQQVKAWCAGGSGAKGMIGHLTAKSLFLQVEEAAAR